MATSGHVCICFILKASVFFFFILRYHFVQNHWVLSSYKSSSIEIPLANYSNMADQINQS